MKDKWSFNLLVDNALFIQEINHNLDSNLSEKLIKNLSNILAIDYVSRLKSKPSLQIYIPLCIQRLQNHLGNKVIVNEDFATSMKLFCVAITDEKDPNNDIHNQKQAQDVAVDAVIDMHFGDLSRTDKEAIKLILKDLFRDKDSAEITNFLNANPRLFHCVLVGAIRDKKKQQEIVEYVKLHINRLIIESKSVDKKIGKIKNLGSKFSLTASLMAVASAGLALGGLVLPAFMIPATAVTIKYSPKAGEKIGEIIANNMESIQNHKQTLFEVKSAVINLFSKTNSISQILVQGEGTSLESIREKLQQQKTLIGDDILQKKSHASNVLNKAGNELRINQARIR